MLTSVHWDREANGSAMIEAEHKEHTNSKLDLSVCPWVHFGSGILSCNFRLGFF